MIPLVAVDPNNCHTVPVDFVDIRHIVLGDLDSQAAVAEILDN